MKETHFCHILYVKIFFYKNGKILFPQHLYLVLLVFGNFKVAMCLFFITELKSTVLKYGILAHCSKVDLQKKLPIFACAFSWNVMMPTD